MRAYRVEKIVPQNGLLELSALPFQAGEMVEIIILSREKGLSRTVLYPLKGKVLKYENPTDPVASDDWEVLK